MLTIKAVQIASKYEKTLEEGKMKNKQYAFPNFLVIESQVILDQRLNATDKILYGIISVLSNNSKGECYASNSYLANFLRCELRTIQRSIAKLKDCNYINTEFLDPGKRVIKTTLNEFIVNRSEIKKLYDFNWLEGDDIA